MNIELKDLVFRHLVESNQKYSINYHFFITGILKDDSECCFYSWIGNEKKKIYEELVENLDYEYPYLSEMKDICENNSIALLSYSNTELKSYVRELAFIKMKNFTDCIITVDETPCQIGGVFNGIAMHKIPVNYLSVSIRNEDYKLKVDNTPKLAKWYAEKFNAEMSTDEYQKKQFHDKEDKRMNKGKYVRDEDDSLSTALNNSNLPTINFHARKLKRITP